MGVLNVTPDSFSDGNLFLSTEAAIEQVLRMFDEGAAIVDIGGESTRPGSGQVVSAELEIDRVMPVMEAVLKDMPVRIVLNDDCGIIGAARYTLVQKAFRTVSRASD